MSLQRERMQQRFANTLCRALFVTLALAPIAFRKPQIPASRNRRNYVGAGRSARNGSVAHYLAATRRGWRSKSPNAANYDEAKANPDPKLPDPLILKNGKKVTTAKMWWDQRRPEIVGDFDREIYGRVPKEYPKSRLGSCQHRQGNEWRHPGGHQEAGRACRQLRLPARDREYRLDSDDSRQREAARCR